MTFATATASGPTYSSCTIPARNAGDLVILCCAVYTTTASNVNAKISSIGALDGVSWNSMGVVSGNTTNTDYCTAYYLWAGSTAASSSVTITAGTNWSTEQASYGVVISGAHASTPPEFTGIAGLDPPNLDPAGWGTEDTLWLAHTAQFNTGLSADPSGFTNLGNVQYSRLAYRNSATSSLNPGAFTGGSGGSAATIAIRPAAVAATNTARMLQFF